MIIFHTTKLVFMETIFKYKRTIIVLLVALLFILGNPGYDSFNKYTSDINFEYNYEAFTVFHHVIRKRVYNFLIFSIYESSVQQYANSCEYLSNRDFIPTNRIRYIGIFYNFFVIK